jgi:hypothetical protein
MDMKGKKKSSLSSFTIPTTQKSLISRVDLCFLSLKILWSGLFNFQGSNAIKGNTVLRKSYSLKKKKTKKDYKSVVPYSLYSLLCYKKATCTIWLNEWNRTCVLVLYINCIYRSKAKHCIFCKIMIKLIKHI